MTKGRGARKRKKRREAKHHGHSPSPTKCAVETKAKEDQIGESRSRTAEAEREDHVEMPTESGNRKRIRDSANSVIAIFTIVIAVIAGITACIYSSQLDEMRIDQRAWLAVKFDPPPQPIVGSMVQAPVFIVNVGKTVAKKVDGWIWFRTEPTDGTLQVEKPPKPETPQTGPLTAWSTAETGVLYPSDPIRFPAAVMVQTPAGEHAPKPIKWDEGMQQSYLHGDSYFVVSGGFTYNDAMGNKHWTTFCGLWPAPTSPKPVSIENSSRCAAFNDVDDNK